MHDSYNKYTAVAVSVFFVAWSIIILGKLFSLHSYVFDLGFVAERLWQPYNIVNASFYQFLFFNSAFQFVLSPVYFFHNLIAILFAQLILFTASVYPLYRIASEKLGKPYYAMLVSVTFLLYFPASGILWFDVHFQSFFVPIFIFAYYFYTKEKYLAAAFLFILSGTVRFPYMILPFLFSFMELSMILIKRKKSFDKRRVYANAAVIISATFILAGGFYYNVISASPVFLAQASSTYPERITTLFLTVLAIMGPLLFLPLTRIRWLILSLPFFVLGLYTGSANYTFPTVMSLQYTSMIVPIAFLGFIEAVGARSLAEGHAYENIQRFLKKFSNAKLFRSFKFIIKDKKKVILGTTICIVVVGSIFYQPYGPLNDKSNLQYHFTNDVGFNTTNYATLQKLVKMVPKNDPYVLFQNDMPEMLPRPGIGQISFLFSTYISSTTNLGDVINNTFPLISPVFLNGQHIESIKVDYLLAFSNTSSYTLQFSIQEVTMKHLVKLSLDSGKYTTLAEENGFILLKRE